TFKHLGVQEGFFQTSILALYQDENGTIWISSANGLFRYNGRLPEEQVNILPREQIKSIAGEHKGKIYFLHFSNIQVYDVVNESFTQVFDYSTLRGGQLTAMCLNNGALYAATRHKIIYCADSTQGVFATIPDNVGEITAMTMATDGNLYFGSISSGFYRVDKEKNINRLINTTTKISAVVEDDCGNIWVATRSEGVFVISISNDTITRYRHNASDNNSLIDNYVRCIAKGDDGLLWIGTMYGLDCFDPSTGIFHHFGKSGNSFSCLRNLTVECIMKDIYGTIWLGTFYTGISYFNSKQVTFNSIPIESDDKTWTVTADMVIDRDGNIWAGTSDKGLYHYNTTTRKTQFFNMTNSRISGNNIKSICYEPDRHILWIGSFMGGVSYYNIARNSFTHIALDNSEDTEIVHRVRLVGKKLYIATYAGVYLLNINTLESKKITSDVKVFDVLPDKDDNLYCVTLNNRFNKYELTSAGHYRQVFDTAFSRSGAITAIIEDSKGFIWLSTTKAGLYRYNKSCNHVEQYCHATSGAESDNISSILELSDGKILAGSAVGLSLINVDSKSSLNYSLVNGFPIVSMQNGCIYRHNDIIYMGGVNGIASCRESLFARQRKPADLLFSRLSVNNRTVNANDETGVLKQALTYTDLITLNYKQTIFKTELCPLDFINFYPAEYRYKLGGYDEQWYSLKDNSISYMNLPPANYKLMVRKVDEDEYISLNIKVLPPWYASLWAYITYLLIAASVIVLIIRYYDSRRKLAFEIKDKEQKEKITQWKLSFFTYITHEFRTPLTLIIGQLDLFMQSSEQNAHRMLGSVRHNAERLKFLIDELIDFRKQEQGYLELKISYLNINALIKKVCLSFTDYANIHKIGFGLTDAPDVYLWCDPVQMQKVIYNLLSNAFKHTHSGGKITLSVGDTDETVFIKVSDTGTGIEKSMFDGIFRRFYHFDNNSSDSGMGIGLALTKSIVEQHGGTITVESEVGKGSVFTVLLRKSNNHFMTKEVDVPENVTKPFLPSFSTQFGETQFGETDEKKSAKRSEPAVLIVEDDTELRSMLVSVFAYNYRTMQADNGQEALLAAREKHPDIIVSDILMPIMSGFDLCREVKSDFETCHIPVVLLTSLTSVANNLQGLETGADDYIYKPFNTSLLLARCNNILNNRALLQNKFMSEPIPAIKTVKSLTTNEIDEHFLNKTLSLINDNINNEKLNISFLCRETALSRTAFFAKIKGITGQTPNNLITNMRLKKAANMLKCTGLPISDISVQSGFNSIQYFSKAFKQHFGLSPGDFRFKK
ncbi:MAG: response regulator, partial [Tannerella sp.]|nr:response regulator [Tannerella sp.]